MKISSSKIDGKRYVNVNHGESELRYSKSYYPGEETLVSIRFNMEDRSVHLLLTETEWNRMKESLDKMIS